MTKKEMLDEMEEAGWSYDTDLDSPYKAVKEDYDEMKKNFPMIPYFSLTAEIMMLKMKMVFNT